MKISILSSSVREGRQSHRVAVYLADKFPEHIKCELIDLKAYDIPRLEYTLGNHPDPSDDIRKIGKLLNESDGIIFLSPEYNGGYSSMLKNTVDYFPKSTYARKPIGIVSVSAGALAGMRGALQMQHLALALWGIPSPTMMLVPNVGDKFDEQENMTDERLKTNCKKFVDDYIWLLEALSAAGSSSN